MKLINSKVELIEQQSGLEGVYKQIELAGRTCYKSEDKITPTSAKEFVDRMIKSGHGAMLEHGTVYLYAPTETYVNKSNGEVEYNNPLEKYLDSPFSVANESVDENEVEGIYVTTNYRVLVENKWLDDLKYICKPTEYHEKRITARFTCDRGVSHEFVRHRVFSFAQESTRFCNYNKDKFANQITYIIPSWCNDLQDGLVLEDTLDVDTLVWGNTDTENINNIKVDEYTRTFLYSCIDSELNYIVLINKGYKPQQARQVLPNALKTELVMTGFESDWKHFFDLRCAPSAHPDARKLASELKELIYGKQEK